MATNTKYRSVECDLTCYRHHAVMNTVMIGEYIKWDSSGKLQQLLLLVKYFAKCRGMSDASLGYLSSYGWVVFTLHVLLHQHLLPPMILTSSSEVGFVLDVHNVDGRVLAETPVSILFYRVLKYMSIELDVIESTVTLRGHGEVRQFLFGYPLYIFSLHPFTSQQCVLRYDES